MNGNGFNGEGDFPLDNPIRQYEGSKDYVYVTYSYKDSKEVFPNLAMLDDIGINVSYNEDLPQSACEFPCREDRIRNSKMLIPFLTPNLVKSDSCSLDIFSAYMHEIPIMPVYLKETSLDEKLNNLIGEEQPILQYALGDEEYHNIFNEELNANLGDKKENDTSNQMNNLFVTGRKASINVEGMSELFSNFGNRIKQSIWKYEFPKPVYLSFAHEDISAIYDDFLLLENIAMDLTHEHYQLLDETVEFDYDDSVDFYRQEEYDSIWLNKVENLIGNSSLFFFYVSERSLASKRRVIELEYAIKNDVTVCLIFLEEIEQIFYSSELFKEKPIISQYNVGRNDYEDAYLDQIRMAISQQTKSTVKIKR